MALFTDEVVISNTPLTVDGSGVTQPVSGSVSVSNFPATQPVSGTVTANAGTGTMLVDGSAHTQPISGTVSISGTVATTMGGASSSTVTQVVGTGSNQTLLASNVNRKKAILFFEASTDYIKLGAVASSSSYTYKITANNTVLEITGWTGIIDAIVSSGKNVLVTELV